MDNKLTSKKIAEYLEDGNNCPLCGGDVQATGDDAYSSTQVWRGVKCTDCKTSFTETYKLVELEINEDPIEGE